MCEREEERLKRNLPEDIIDFGAACSGSILESFLIMGFNTRARLVYADDDYEEAIRSYKERGYVVRDVMILSNVPSLPRERTVCFVVIPPRVIRRRKLPEPPKPIVVHFGTSVEPLPSAAEKQAEIETRLLEAKIGLALNRQVITALTELGETHALIMNEGLALPEPFEEIIFSVRKERELVPARVKR